MIASHRVNGGGSIGFKVDEHQWGTSLHFMLKRPEMVAGRNNNEAIHAAGDERRNKLIMTGWITVGTGRQHQIVMFASHIFNASQNRGEERVRNINQKKPDHIAPQLRRSQRSRPIVGPVAKFVNRRPYPDREVRADPCLAVYDPGNRFEADAGIGRDVMNRRSTVLFCRYCRY
jgi:hypothetical protein